MASSKKIKDSLIKQLNDKGANVEHFKDLISDYIYYWNLEKSMQKDVKERGLTFETTSSSGHPITKENPSIKNAVQYNKQKLAILKELGITTSNVVNEDDDEL